MFTFVHLIEFSCEKIEKKQIEHAADNEHYEARGWRLSQIEFQMSLFCDERIIHHKTVEAECVCPLKMLAHLFTKRFFCPFRAECHLKLQFIIMCSGIIMRCFFL